MRDGELARVDYDAELHRHNEVLRRAYEIGPGDRVLDVGCGAGQTTRDAARLAGDGWALGIDISKEMIERARSLAEAEDVRNVSFEVADAQDRRFSSGQFDVAISRFGTMFFEDSRAAFDNIGQGIRSGGRLLMIVWQSRERNEWSLSIEEALASAAGPAGPAPKSLDPFSLADPATVRSILAATGFTDVTFTDVNEPMFFGRDVAAALEWVRGFAVTKAVLDRLDDSEGESALERLRETLAAHAGDDGVWFSSRAWIVKARRP